jgi:hypothetical protein
VSGRALVIDGQHLAWRCYYAIPFLSAPDGTPTNAVFGFMSRLREMLDLFKPARAVVCWDGGRNGWRRQVFAGYKESREKPGLKTNRTFFEVQRKLLMTILDEVLLIPQLVMPDVEGDDLVAHAAEEYERQGLRPVVASSDHDFLQLVSESVTVYDAMKSDWVTLASFDEITKIPDPDTFLDKMIICGDHGDGVPAVKGLSGDKKFLKWMPHLRANHLPQMLRTWPRFQEYCPELLREKFLPRYGELKRNWQLVDLGFGAAKIAAHVKWPAERHDFDGTKLWDLAARLSMRSVLIGHEDWLTTFRRYHESK